LIHSQWFCIGNVTELILGVVEYETGVVR